MLIAAAVCPHPPLLVPEVTGASDPAARELDRLRTACRDAVAVLIGAAPDLLVVTGGAGQTTDVPGRSRGEPARLRASRSPWARTRSCRSR